MYSPGVQNELKQLEVKREKEVRRETRPGVTLLQKSFDFFTLSVQGELSGSTT